MGAETVAQAAQAMKKAQGEMVQWEHNVASMEQKLKDKIRERDEVQKQIDQKVANANILLSEERNKLEVTRRKVQDEDAVLKQAKAELADQIAKMKEEKAAFDKEKEDTKTQLLMAKNLRGRVDAFIVAVQKAYQVLG